MPDDGRFDAVVIGGGPAGSLAALHLNRAGWRTALIEKRQRHTAKTCGHCLHRRGLRRLEALGLGDVVAHAQVGASAQLRVHEAGRRGQRTAAFDLTFHRETEPPSVLVRRDVFDQALIDRARREGVIVFQPAAAKVSSGGRGRVAVRIDDAVERLRCNLIVGADGLRSAVARLIDADGGSARVGGKFGFSFDLPASAGADDLGRDAVDMFVTELGYLGVVREQDGTLHVAALVQQRASRDLFRFVRETAGQFEALRAAGFENLCRRDVRALHGAGPIPWRAKRVSGRGVALVGDAAEFIEPFTGEGMCWAIESASVFGAVATAQPVGVWDDCAAARYEQDYGARVASGKSLCRAAAAALQRPMLCRVLMQVGAVRWTGAGRVVRKVVRG